MVFPGGSGIKSLPANEGNAGLIHVWGRSPGEGNGNPIQYSCLGNPMDRGAWWAIVHGVAKESDTTCVHWPPTHWDPLDCSPPGSSVHGIFQGEYWNGLPFPVPEDLPDPGIKPKSLMSPALASRFFTIAPPGKPNNNNQFSSVHFSLLVMSNSLQPHGLHQARLPCPSPTPRAYSNSCASSRWCHPTISSSVIPFSSRLQSRPASVFSNESVLPIEDNNLMKTH